MDPVCVKRGHFPSAENHEEKHLFDPLQRAALEQTVGQSDRRGPLERIVSGQPLVPEPATSIVFD